ncbi:MAG: recombinase family protein [Pseudomonadota bacterium]
MTSTIVGYARVSTVDQDASYEDQQQTLRDAGATRIFHEKVSAVSGQREQLDAALDYVREGDTLVVTRLDRLARSLSDLMKLTETLRSRSVELRVLDGLNLDTGTPHGKLVLGVIGAVAEFERNLMLERQRVGIEKAKREGRYKGRAPTARAKSHEVLALVKRGASVAEAARRTGISRSSAYRILATRTFSQSERTAV